MFLFQEIYVIGIFIAAILFWGIPEQYRTRFLIATSFIALGFIQLKFTIFLVLLILFVYWGGKAIERTESGRYLLFMVVILVVVLFSFKYTAPLFELIFSSEQEFSKKYMVPLGISYLSFKLIAYILDTYRGTIKNPRIEDLLAFILFFPIFPAGPIERFQSFIENRKKNLDISFFIEGLQRLTIGYAKKIILVNFILHEIIYKDLLPKVIGNSIPLEVSGLMVLFFLVGSLVYAYIDLSAYADIAIGFGQLFGYKICENMNYPIFQKNLSDYWNCWHISLSHWCRNNIYFPVLGRFRNNVVALYCSFIVMGLWHYISFNWILWGMWHASGIITYSKWHRYKIRNKKIKNLLPPKFAFILGVVLTVIYSGMGFAFIMSETPAQAFRILSAIVL